MIIDKLDNTYLIINAKLTGDAFTLLSALPGYSRWEGRALRFRPVDASIAYLLEHFPDARWEPGALPYLTRYRASVKSAATASKDKRRSVKELARRYSVSYDFGTAPYDHQLKAFLLSRDSPFFALFMEQGTGKTKVILDTAGHLYNAGRITALVVIAPNGVHDNWVKFEAPKHLPAWLPYRAWAYSSNVAKYRLRQMEDALAFEGLRIITINVEGFASEKAQKLLTRILREQTVLLVVDESSRIKNPRAKRTKFILATRKAAPFRRLLSGTPITRGMEDIYSQMAFLSPSIIGLDTYTTFKQRYCITRKVGFGELIVGYQNQEELISKIDAASFRVLKTECLDLPPKVYKRFPVHLTAKQASAYNSLVEDFIADMDGMELTADLAVTRLLRLQQIICNWYKADGAKEPIPLGDENPRLAALMTILEDTEGKAIVWARFVKDLDLIAEKLGKSAIRYRGDVGDVQRFQEDERIRYFIANPATAGLGLTLTAAQTVVYYSNDFDLEHRLQSEDRTHRIGTTGSVTYIDIDATGTVDSKIINSLREKKLISDAVLQDPAGFFMEYGDE
jgi:hypothetical protein